MKAPKYSLLWSNEAKKRLSSVPDKRIQAKIVERGEELAWEPEIKKGLALSTNPLICLVGRAGIEPATR